VSKRILTLRNEVISARDELVAVAKAIRAWYGRLVDSDDVPRFCDAFDAYYKAFARFLKVYRNFTYHPRYSKATRVKWNALWLLLCADFERFCVIMETLVDCVNQEIAIIRRLRKKSRQNGIDRGQ